MKGIVIGAGVAAVLWYLALQAEAPPASVAVTNVGNSTGATPSSTVTTGGVSAGQTTPTNQTSTTAIPGGAVSSNIPIGPVAPIGATVVDNVGTAGSLTLDPPFNPAAVANSFNEWVWSIPVNQDPGAGNPSRDPKYAPGVVVAPPDDSELPNIFDAIELGDIT